MNEARRLAYLRAMEIDSYVRGGPGAVADNGRDGTGEQLRPRPELSAAGERETERGRPTGRLDQLKAGLEDGQTRRAAPSARESSQRTKPQSPATGPGGVEADADQLRFSLQFFPVSEKLAVINEIPYLGNDRILQRTGRLLQAILRALDVVSERPLQADRFNWPLAAADDASSTRAQEAHQALDGFLRRRMESDGFQVVLVFGSQCQALFDRAGIDAMFEGRNARVIHTHSLASQLQVPTLKQSVWDDIRVVRDLVNS